MTSKLKKLDKFPTSCLLTSDWIWEAPVPETAALLRQMEPKEYWESLAPWYIKHTPQIVGRDPLIGEFLGRACDTPFVLDVGCGYGRALPALLAFSDILPMFAYIGVDYSRPMLEEAQRQFPDGDFREGAIGALSAAVPEICDAFLAICALETFPRKDVRGALKDIRSRLCRGALGLICLEYGTKPFVVTTDTGPGVLEGMQITFYPWTPLELAQYLNGTGFESCEARFLGDSHFCMFVKAI